MMRLTFKKIFESDEGEERTIDNVIYYSNSINTDSSSCIGVMYIDATGKSKCEFFRLEHRMFVTLEEMKQ